jgi:2-hydroxychromene-2-carboxylate isomerase
MPTTAPRATFYFDLGSPYAYLAAERIGREIPEPVRWQPILLGGLFKLTGRSSWALGDGRRRREGMAGIEARARSYGLPAVRWPDPWPGSYLFAMRAATHAVAAGQGRAFAMQAFRDAFQRGADLSIPAVVLESARRTGLDPAAVEAAAADPELKAELRAETDAAHALGVIGVPTVAIAGRLYWGDDQLEAAAADIAGV